MLVIFRKWLVFVTWLKWWFLIGWLRARAEIMAYYELRRMKRLGFVIWAGCGNLRARFLSVRYVKNFSFNIIILLLL